MSQFSLHLQLHLITLISRSGAGDKFSLVGTSFPSKFSLVAADKQLDAADVGVRYGLAETFLVNFLYLTKSSHK